MDILAAAGGPQCGRFRRHRRGSGRRRGLGDVPVTYVVAPDDLIDEVASRFGITRDDVFYLNPARLPSPMSETLRVGEVLNLSVERR